MGRLLTATLWILALGSLVATWTALTELAPSPHRPTPSAAQDASARTRPAEPIRTAAGTWRVVDHLIAEHVAVIHVETDRLRDARQIAVALTEPIKQDYAEILVYFHRPGRRHQLPARRVQWSPRRGYTETIYERPVSRPRGLAAWQANPVQDAQDSRHRD